VLPGDLFLPQSSISSATSTSSSEVTRERKAALIDHPIWQ
jgi:hypothetical protein